MPLSPCVYNFVDMQCCYAVEMLCLDLLSLPVRWWQWDSLITTRCGGCETPCYCVGARSCFLLLSYCPGFLWAFCPFLLVPFRKLLSSWWGLGSGHFSYDTVSLSTLLSLSIPSSLRQCRGRKAFIPHQNRKQQGPCSSTTLTGS